MEAPDSLPRGGGFVILIISPSTDAGVHRSLDGSEVRRDDLKPSLRDSLSLDDLPGAVKRSDCTPPFSSAHCARISIEKDSRCVCSLVLSPLPHSFSPPSPHRRSTTRPAT